MNIPNQHSVVCPSATGPRYVTLKRHYIVKQVGVAYLCRFKRHISTWTYFVMSVLVGRLGSLLMVNQQE